MPSVDLRAGKVVRLKQGDYNQQIDYSVEPIQVVHTFAAAGAAWMHIVDLDGAKSGRPEQTPLITRMILTSGLKVQVGGGIRSTEDVDRVLDAGASRVVLGTKAMEDWAWFENLANQGRYSQKLVLALDGRDGVVATRGWTEASGKLAVDVAKLVSDWPLGAILYTDVAKDGMLAGPNIERTVELAQAGKVPVIASGGVGSVEDIRKLVGTGVWGVIVGRSLYEGKVDLAEALKAAKG